MNLSEWIQHQKNQQAYKEWLDHHVTKAILEGVAATQARVQLLEDPTGERAIQRVGYLAGKDAVLHAMTSLLDLINDPMAGIENDPRIDYLVNLEGRTRAEAIKILTTHSERLSKMKGA